MAASNTSPPRSAAPTPSRASSGLTRSSLLSCAVAALALGSVGCLGVNTGRPERRAPTAKVSLDRPERATPIRWERIFAGYGKSTRLVGYLRTEGRRGSAPPQHWVYDTDFNMIGYASPEGHTIRLLGRGRERHIGSYRLDQACVVLFKLPLKTGVTFKRMPPPRG